MLSRKPDTGWRREQRRLLMHSLPIHLLSLKAFLLFTTAFIAGAINSVAGGGTLLTFPALLWAGVSPITANATSTVALVPGSLSAFWGYRREMTGDRSAYLWLGLPSLLGGLLGALLLIRTGDALFQRLAPWLIFTATGLFMAQEPLRRWMDRRISAQEIQDRETLQTPGGRSLVGLMLFQFVVALYGGFFGAGIGILMLAALGLLGLKNIHRMNGLKNFAAVCINGVAAATFIGQDRVHWVPALLMMGGAILGGYGGAGVAQRLGQRNVRRIVVGIGLLIGLWMLIRRF